MSIKDAKFSALSQMLARRSTARRIYKHTAPEPMSVPDIPIFVYGSLMVPDVLRDALHLEPDSELIPRYKYAILLEYSRYKVIGARFPAIAPCPGGNVTGRLIYLRDASQAVALDDMERVLYTKKEVLVQTTDGQQHRAYTFVWKGREEELDSDPWDMRHYLIESGLQPT